MIISKWQLKHYGDVEKSKTKQSEDIKEVLLNGLKQ